MNITSFNHTLSLTNVSFSSDMVVSENVRWIALLNGSAKQPGSCRAVLLLGDISRDYNKALSDKTKYNFPPLFSEEIMRLLVRRLSLLLMSLAFALGHNAIAQAPPLNSSPIIVSSVSLVHKNGNVNQTSLFRPRSSGLYRISANMLGASNGFLELCFEWSGPDGAAVQCYQNNNTDGTAGTSVTGTFRMTKDAPVTFYTEWSGTSEYDVYFTIERLQ
jgi:hypothetical protein